MENFWSEYVLENSVFFCAGNYDTPEATLYLLNL